MKLHPLRTFLAWIVIIYVVCVAIVSSVKAKNYPVSQQIFIPELPSTTTSTGIKRTELERRKIAGTEQEMRLYLIVYPPGVAAPVHHHSTVGMGYILEGTFESAFGSDKPRTYHAGQSFQDLAIVPHTIFRNVDKHKPLKFLAYYVVKSGEPVIVTP